MHKKVTFLFLQKKLLWLHTPPRGWNSAKKIRWLHPPALGVNTPPQPKTLPSGVYLPPPPQANVFSKKNWNSPILTGNFWRGDFLEFWRDKNKLISQPPASKILLQGRSPWFQREGGISTRFQENWPSNCKNLAWVSDSIVFSLEGT